MNVDLAARIVSGAHAGRLLLTIDEARHLLDYLADQPHAAVIVNGTPIPIATLPVTDMDELADNLRAGPDTTDPWHRNLLGSFADGYLDADDVERLWKRPT